MGTDQVQLLLLWDAAGSSVRIFKLKSVSPCYGLMVFGSIPILLKSVVEKTYFAHWSEQSLSELF